jgi:putative SOS response-associated peptidase YedK
MCNRYRPGERETIRQHFDAKLWRQVNDGPGIVHPKDPGWVVRAVDGELVLDQMTWGFRSSCAGRRANP